MMTRAAWRMNCRVASRPRPAFSPIVITILPAMLVPAGVGGIGSCPVAFWSTSYKQVKILKLRDGVRQQANKRRANLRTDIVREEGARTYIKPSWIRAALRTKLEQVQSILATQPQKRRG